MSDPPVEGDLDDAPFVCPGCYAVGDEPCAPDCVDASIERERQHRSDYDEDYGQGWYPHDHDDEDEPVPESQRQEPLQEAAAEIALCQKRLERSMARLIDGLTPIERGLVQRRFASTPRVRQSRRSARFPGATQSRHPHQHGRLCRWCRELVETPSDEADHDFCEPRGPYVPVSPDYFERIGGVIPVVLQAMDEVLCSACRTLHPIRFDRILSHVTHSTIRVQCPCGYDIDAVYGWGRGQVVQVDVRQRARRLYRVK